MISLGLILGAASGCDSSNVAPATTTTDSAGITIVQSNEPAWSAGDAWTVGTQPILTIGALDGPPETLLDRVMGVVVLDGGRVVIGNMGDNTLRYFSADGHFEFQRGGDGGGPEEFHQILRLYQFDDFIVADQFGPNPAKLFAPDGKFLGALPGTPPALGGGSLVIGTFSDRARLVQRWPQGRDGKGMAVSNTALYVVTDETSDANAPLLSLPAVRHVPVSPRIRTAQEFGPMAAVFLDRDRIYYSWPESYDIQVFDRNGRLQRRIRRSWEPVPVTSDDIAEYRRYMLEGPTERGGPPPPRLVEQRRRIADGMVFPEHHPALHHFITDRLGNLWVRRIDEPDYSRYDQRSLVGVSSTPIAWDVFDTTGVWLGSVDTPARFHVFEVGGNYVAGVWKDDLAVEFVHIYPLRKPTTNAR